MVKGMLLAVSTIILLHGAQSLAVVINSPLANASINAGNYKAFKVSGTCVSDVKVKLYASDIDKLYAPMVSVDCVAKKFSGVLDTSTLKNGAIRLKASQVVNGVSEIIYVSVLKDVSAVNIITIEEPTAAVIVNTANYKAIAVSGACTVALPVKLYISDANSLYAPTVTATCVAGKYAGALDASTLKDGSLRLKATQYFDSVPKNIYVPLNKDTVKPVLNVSSPTNGQVISQDFILKGNCEAGSNLTISSDQLVTGAKITCQGAFSQSLRAKSLGAITLSLAARDVALNKTSLSLSYTAGELPKPSPSPSPTVSPTVPPSGSAVAPQVSRFAKVSAGTVSVNVANFSEAVTAVAAAAPNTKIILPAGKFANVVANFAGKGSENKPVIIQGDEKGGTILSGKMALTLKGSFVLLKNIVFDNPDATSYSGSSSIIYIDACVNCGIQNIRMNGGPAADMDTAGNDKKHFKSIRIKPNSYGLEVSNSSFIGKRNGGSVILIERNAIWAGVGDDHRIFKNLFSGRELQGMSANDFDVIRIGSSSSSHTPSSVDGANSLAKGQPMAGTIVEFNIFENGTLSPAVLAACVAAKYSGDICSAEPEIISVKGPQNVIRFNTFRNNYGGLTLRHGYQNLVEGNFFSGKNIPAGISAINQFSYGIRIIGADNLVMSNHMEDLYAKGSMLAGISMVAGQVGANESGYWQVENAIVAFNNISNVATKPISFASDYGSRSKTLPPTNVVLSGNAVSASVAVIDNQAPNDDFLSSFVVKDLYYKASSLGATKITGKALAIASKEIPGRGFTAPTNAELIGNSGILRSTDSRRQTLLKDLAGLAGGTNSAILENMMKSLLIQEGTVYERYSPLLPSEVGSSF